MLAFLVACSEPEPRPEPVAVPEAPAPEAPAAAAAPLVEAAPPAVPPPGEAEPVPAATGPTPKASPVARPATPTTPAPSPPSAPEPVALATPAPADPPAEATVTPTVPVLPTSWTLDPARSSLYVQVFKDPTTTAAGLSHDHVIAATGWSGSVTWPADLSGCAVSVSVPTSGLRADADAMRARVGYESRLSEDQRKEITGHFLAADQLDAARFPTLTFEATGCESAKDRVRVTGALTIHGVAKTIMVPLKVSVTDTTFAAAGTFTARATDFGFSPFTALLGALKNKDEMTFTLDVKGSPR